MLQLYSNDSTQIQGDVLDVTEELLTLPVGDVLLRLCSTRRLVRSEYTFVYQNGFREWEECKLSRLIGSYIDRKSPSTILLVKKQTIHEWKRRKGVSVKCEPHVLTIRDIQRRVRVNLPGNRTHFVRVKTDIALSKVLKQICSERGLLMDSYSLLHPKENYSLDLNLSLDDYGINVVTLTRTATLVDSNLSLSGVFHSTKDISCNSNDDSSNINSQSSGRNTLSSAPTHFSQSKKKPFLLKMFPFLKKKKRKKSFLLPTVYVDHAKDDDYSMTPIQNHMVMRPSRSMDVLPTFYNEVSSNNQFQDDAPAMNELTADRVQTLNRFSYHKKYRAPQPPAAVQSPSPQLFPESSHSIHVTHPRQDINTESQNGQPIIHPRKTHAAPPPPTSTMAMYSSSERGIFSSEILPAVTKFSDESQRDSVTKNFTATDEWSEVIHNGQHEQEHTHRLEEGVSIEEGQHVHFEESIQTTEDWEDEFTSEELSDHEQSCSLQEREENYESVPSYQSVLKSNNEERQCLSEMKTVNTRPVRVECERRIGKPDAISYVFVSSNSRINSQSSLSSTSQIHSQNIEPPQHTNPSTQALSRGSELVQSSVRSEKFTNFRSSSVIRNESRSFKAPDVSSVVEKSSIHSLTSSNGPALPQGLLEALMEAKRKRQARFANLE